MTRVLTLLLVSIPLCACVAQPPYCGVGGLGLPDLGSLPGAIEGFQRDGINHIQCSIDAGAPDVRQRVEMLHSAGFDVRGYDSAFIGLSGEREDYQVRADGSIKEGTVCPRSPRRAAEMLEATKAIADTGADGMIWDFVTVESRTFEACFCPRCVAAFNAAAGTSHDRDGLAKAIHEDKQALSVWLKVREESTTTALSNLCTQVAAHTAGRERPFPVGGYVVDPGSDLGMDTVALRSAMGTLAPMIYQASAAAPLGWMKSLLAKYVAMPGDAEVIECIDAGFFVDEPISELIATSWDCLRAGIDGYAFWPLGKMSGEDMAGVRGVNQLAALVYRPLRAGDKAGASAGLGKLLDTISGAIGRFGSVEDKGLWAGIEPVLREGAQARDLNAWIEDDGTLRTMETALNAYARANVAELHAADRVISLPPYRVTISEVANSVQIASPEWTLRWDGRAVNIDDLEFPGLSGDASTDAYELGLLRTRVVDWFDPWGSTNRTTIAEQTADHLTLVTQVQANDCVIARRTTLRRGSDWLDVTLSVENTGAVEHSGRLWLWNGIGIPGFLEAGESCWEDDDARLLGESTLLVTDESRFVAVEVDTGFWKLGGRGGDGASHAFREITLKPGERIETPVRLTFGGDYPVGWEERQAEGHQ